MPWVRIDDGFSRHPKVVAAGPLAMAMQVAGLCYCNKELTDGFVPRSVARTLLDWEMVRDDGRIYSVGVSYGMQGQDVSCAWVISCLVESGMWIETDGGYLIHDYEDYQPSKEQISAERAKNADRQARWRDKQGTNGFSNGVSNDVSNGPVTSPPYPVPVPVPVSRKPNPKTEPREENETVSSDQKIEPERKKPKRVDYSGEFETFWNHYPNHNGSKQDAYAEWQKLDQADRDLATSQIPFWRETREWRDGFAKHAERYLKGRQFDQEPTPFASLPPPTPMHRNGRMSVEDHLAGVREAQERERLAAQGGQP